MKHGKRREIVLLAASARPKMNPVVPACHSGANYTPEMPTENVYAAPGLEKLLWSMSALIVAVEYVETAIKNGTSESTDPVTAALLNRVQAGLVESDRTPNGVKHFYRSVMGV